MAPRPKQADFSTYDEFEAADEAWIGARVAQAETAATAAAERAINERFAQQQVQAEQLMQQRAFEAAQQQFEARTAEGKAKYAAFDTVTRSTEVKVTPPVADLITHGVAGPEVSYYLGSHPAIAEALVDLPITMPIRDALLQADNAPAVLAHLVAHPEECQQLASLPPLVALSRANRLVGRLAAQAEYEAGREPAAVPAKAVAPSVPMPRLSAPPKPVGGTARSQVSLSDPNITHEQYKAIRRAQRQAQGRAW